MGACGAHKLGLTTLDQWQLNRTSSTKLAQPCFSRALPFLPRFFALSSPRLRPEVLQCPAVQGPQPGQAGELMFMRSCPALPARAAAAQLHGWESRRSRTGKGSQPMAQPACWSDMETPLWKLRNRQKNVLRLTTICPQADMGFSRALAYRTHFSSDSTAGRGTFNYMVRLGIRRHFWPAGAGPFTAQSH